MFTPFAAPHAAEAMWKPLKMSGSTVDRLSTVRIKSGNGRSSITANVAPHGGPGVTIVPRLNWGIGPRESPIVRFQIRLMIGRWAIDVR